MIESAFWLLMNSLLLTLRIMPGDSFPKPLGRAEEEEYLARWEKGDVEARNTTSLTPHRIVRFAGMRRRSIIA